MTYNVFVGMLNPTLLLLNTAVMLCVMADELSIPITVDEYTKQLRELQVIHFPEAGLLPGMLCFKYL